MIDKIVKTVQKGVAEKKKNNYYARLPARTVPVLSFDDFLIKSKFNVIAEVKKASPSQGDINLKINPVNQALMYEKNGASAVSVLTEEKFFKGSLNYLKEIKNAVKIPVLRKDFIVDEAQIQEAYSFGADAVLLISDILTAAKLKKLYDAACRFNLSVLAECHTAAALKKIITVGCRFIGINNRNLKNMTIDLKTTAELISTIPPQKIIISESGVSSEKDAEYLASIGADGILIGTRIMKSSAPEKFLKNLINAGRKGKKYA